MDYVGPFMVSLYMVPTFTYVALYFDISTLQIATLSFPSKCVSAILLSFTLELGLVDMPPLIDYW